MLRLQFQVAVLSTRYAGERRAALWQKRRCSGVLPCATDSRRRDCHSADTPSASLLKRLLKGEWGCSRIDSLAGGWRRTCAEW